MSELIIEPETSKVVKSGEIVTQVILHRSMKGLTVNIKAHEAVEEFSRALGDGESQDIKIYGRHWHPVGDTPLRIYNHDPKLAKIEPMVVVGWGNGKENLVARYDRPGHPLLDEHGYLNISYLRLVGVSSGPGITFGVSGIYTLENLRAMRDKISAACRQFYIHYMRPVDLSVTISTQELQL